MTGFAPRPPLACWLVLWVAVLARPARGLPGFPDPVTVPAPCDFDYQCNMGVCQQHRVPGRGQCACSTGWATVNVSRPCWVQAQPYQEIVLMTWLGLGVFATQAFALGWWSWGLATMVALAAALLARCCEMYLGGQRQARAQALLPAAENTKPPGPAERWARRCALACWVAYGVLALGLAVVATARCVDERGVRCA